MWMNILGQVSLDICQQRQQKVQTINKQIQKTNLQKNPLQLNKKLIMKATDEEKPEQQINNCSGKKQQSIQISIMIIPDQGDSQDVFERYVGLQRMLQFVDNQAYMEYKDYQDVRMFYEANRDIYQDGRIGWSQKYQLALLTAKAYYTRYEYKAVLKTIQQNLPMPPPGQFYTYKIFYERQILLLKSIYLQNPKQTHKLDLVNNEYHSEKEKCLDWASIEASIEVYEETLGNLWEKLKRGGQIIKKNAGNSRSLVDWVKNIEKNTGIFAGIPVYLVSIKWLQKAIKFAKNPKQNPYPGPAFNLQLCNHIFQFQSHIQQNKFYMNSLLFSITQSIDYKILSQKQWKETQQKFQGWPIKRFPVQDKIFSVVCKSDCLIKTVIEKNDVPFIFQWQGGVSWEYSILPYMRDKIFGMGQLKCLIKKINKQKIPYTQEVLVQNGIIQSSKNRYKFTQIHPELQIKISPKLLTRFLTRYNLQPYPSEPNPEFYSAGIISLSANSGDLVKYVTQLKNKYLTQEQSAKFEVNLNEIHTVLYCLGSIEELMTLYCRQIFIEEFTKDRPDQEIQYAMSISDFVKKVWFSNRHQDTTSPLPLIKSYLRYSILKNILKSKYIHFPYKQTQSNSICHLLEQLILPLHHTQTEKKQQLIYSEWQVMKSQGVSTFKKQNSLEIFNVFNQHHYHEFRCWSCNSPIGYKMLPKLTMLVNVKQCWEYLNFYFVRFMGKQTTDFKTEGEHGFSHQKLGKTVQELYLKFPLKNTVKDVFSIIRQKYSPPQESQKNQFIPLFINVYDSEFYAVQDQSTSIKELNSLISLKNNPNQQNSEENNQKNPKNKQKKWFLFIYSINLAKEKEQFTIVNFKNPSTGLNKGFPELVRIPNLKKSLKQGENHEKNKQIIRNSLTNPNIQIKRFQVLKLKQQEMNSRLKIQISSWINIYTDTKIGSVERVIRHPVADQKFEQNKYNQKYWVSLEECIKKTFHCQDQVKKEQKSKVNKKLPLFEKKIFCHKCKKEAKCVSKIKLLEFRKVVVIGINRKNLAQSHRISTSVKFPQSLNVRQFLSSPSSPTKKKAPQYILKSIILYQSPLTQSSHATKSKQKYAALIRSSSHDKWYLMQNQTSKEFKIEDVDGRRVQMLVYQRKQQI